MRLSDVTAIYDGVQAQLYELFMGRQIHIGGLESSLELAEAAGVGAKLSQLRFVARRRT